MEVDIEEDENEPELIYHYEVVDSLNPPSPDSESEPEDVNEVENTIEHGDETVPAIVYEIGESSTAPFLREDSDGLLPDDVPIVEPNQHNDVLVVPELVLVDEDEDLKEKEFEEEKEPQEEEEDDMEVDIKEDENEPELAYPYKEVDPLNPPPPAFDSKPKDVVEVENTIEHEDETVPTSVHETAHALVEKKGKEKDEYYGKLILGLGNKVHFSVEQGMNAIEKLVEKLGNAEEKAECKKLKKELEEARIMPPKSTPLTQAAIHQMIKESVDVAIAAERARHANVRNDARESGPVRVKMPHLLFMSALLLGL
nr:hypothetical protein [Tanacetum cinerariifolium]